MVAMLMTRKPETDEIGLRGDSVVSGGALFDFKPVSIEKP